MKKTIPLAVLAAAVAVLLFLLLRSLGGVDPVAGAFEAETAAEEGLELAGPLEAPLPPEASDPTAPDEVARGEGRREAAGAVASPSRAAPVGPIIPTQLLTARQQLVLSMLFEDGMDVGEVAEALGVNPQTIRSTKHKAMERLRAHFRGGEGGDDPQDSGVQPEDRT